MDLFHRIKTNTTLLTPNRRLSAAILKQYSAWQVAQGKQCWPTLDILPLTSWLERLWKEYSARELTETRILLSTQQEQILWEKILRDAPENESLLQLTDTAKLAKSAWEILKKWRVKLTDPELKLTEDSRAFLQWATHFQKYCKKNNCLDLNSLADLIAENIGTNRIQPQKNIILVGFTEIAPQYQHLLKVCEAQGIHLTYHEQDSSHAIIHKIGLNDTDTEISSMARWAKSFSEKGKTVGCVIPNLESIRESVVKTFSNVFGESRFNISAGKSLISYPIIHDALQLLSLNTKTLSTTMLSSILRSPFIGEAERERYKRAIYDGRLRNSNIASMSLQQLIDPNIKHSLINTCPALAKRINDYVAYLATTSTLLPISQWVIHFNTLLTLLGWPGERSLNSHEYQVVQNCWLPLLNEYATLDHILEPQPYHKAFHYLTCLASSKVFQPESPESNVQILGLLEAAEIPFDHLWVMGLDDTTWPSRPKPNPFIPLRLQKTLSMPNASAERELLYCQQLTKQLYNSAKEVIFSYPEQRDDAELRPSSLLKYFPSIESNQLELSSFIPPAENIYQAQQLEWLQDHTAPSIPASDEVQGGVSIFKNQAQCPFKAFAELRLHAKKMEDTTLGLRKLDRGNIVHKALEFIWRELKDSNTLITMPDHELKKLIHQCAQDAMQEIIESNHAESSRYLELELRRLEKIIWDWLAIEKNRPAFSIEALEHEISAKIGNITTQFRVDRIDKLLHETSEAKHLIIDYKTGKEINKNGWFGARLDEPQLPIYCILNPDNTIGIAFGKVNPNKMEMQGTSKVPLKLQSVIPISDIKQADATSWDQQIQTWHANLVKLADDFYHGRAEVDPKDPNMSCRHCGLQALCRVHEITDFDEELTDEPN